LVGLHPGLRISISDSNEDQLKAARWQPGFFSLQFIPFWAFQRMFQYTYKA